MRPSSNSALSGSCTGGSAVGVLCPQPPVVCADGTGKTRTFVILLLETINVERLLLLLFNQCCCDFLLLLLQLQF
uniref:Secreted protein n=1 Tax=Peronospora matthiolae TaxID=2874970 RepID=A0AAV1U9A9_9STRA